MNITEPRITAAHLRAALATACGVVVQDAYTGTVTAIPHGLTKAQMSDPTVIVLLTNPEAEFYVRGAGGSYASAARTATVVLRFELDLVENSIDAKADLS